MTPVQYTREDAHSGADLRLGLAQKVTEITLCFDHLLTTDLFPVVNLLWRPGCLKLKRAGCKINLLSDYKDDKSVTT